MNIFFKAACVAGAAMFLAAGSAEARQMGGQGMGGSPGGFRGGGPMVHSAPSMPRANFNVGGGPRAFRAHPNFSPNFSQKIARVPHVGKPGWVPKGDHRPRPHIVQNYDKGHGRHHHRRHGRFLVYASPFYDNYYDNYYYDDSYASGDCAWYWQRYLTTGLKKWKYRYYQCIE